MSVIKGQYSMGKRRTKDNLAYYINGSRVTKTVMSNYLANFYGMSPKDAIENRVKEAKAFMRNNHVTYYQNAKDGTMITK